VTRVSMSAAVIAMMVAAGSASAGPVVGSSNTATAEPELSRPRTTPCVVELYRDVTFANFDPKLFTFTPPAGCQGPWAKVVLTADFAVSAGRQFDRTGNIWIGGVSVYFGTTMQPSRTVSRSWHVERDLTEYSALLAAPQAGKVVLGNLVNETYTGIITGTAKLEFFPVARGRRAPEVADVVVPLSDAADGGTVLLQTGNDALARSVTLPRNVDRAYLEVFSQSQYRDEFWYACVPDELSTPLQSCGGTAFREAQVTIDGQPAGIAPIYPWFYTGAIDPYMWRPIPGVQALNFTPYRVDLTPFAGLLSDGAAHEVAIRVTGANDYFMVTGTLLAYLDHAATQVTGRILVNTVGTPLPVVTDDVVAGDGTALGTVSTTSARTAIIVGLVTGSRGTRKVTVTQNIAFSNVQTFDISAPAYLQTITQGTTASSLTLAIGPAGIESWSDRQTWPMELTYAYRSAEDGTATQTTGVDLAFQRTQARTKQGLTVWSRKESNHVTPLSTQSYDAGGVLVGVDDASDQDYWEQETGSPCYRRALAAERGILLSITDGGRCSFE
jgi:hypothetical protein